MPDTDAITDSGMLELTQDWEQLAEAFEKRDRPEMAQAIRDFANAISYPDPDEILLKSTHTSMMESLALVVRDIVKAQLGMANEMKQVIRNGLIRLTGMPILGDKFDEVRKLARAFIDERVARMTRMRDDLLQIVHPAIGHTEHAQQLEDAVADLRNFEEGMKEFLSPEERSWPLNKEAVGESRAAAGQKDRWRKLGRTDTD